jgi:hypothetical protein
MRLLEEAEGDVVDFDQFVMIVHNASDETTEEFPTSDWDYSVAVSCLRMRRDKAGSSRFSKSFKSMLMKSSISRGSLKKSRSNLGVPKQSRK